MMAHSPGQLVQLPADDIMNGVNMQMDPIDNPVEHRKLVILGLPWETTEDTFRQYFEQFGNIEVSA
jgi:RNA recognition motif-containing protein